MERSILLLLLVSCVGSEQFDTLAALPSEVVSNVVKNDPVLSASGLLGGDARSTVKKLEETLGMGGVSSMADMLKGAEETLGKDSFLHKSEGMGKSGGGMGNVGVPKLVKHKVLKSAVVGAVPLKKVAVKKVVAAKVFAPVAVKALPVVALKSKPKVHSLEPIVHIVEKPVAVFHKVPVPKKVLVPKFIPVPKIVPVPKFVPAPFKVPVKKIIPKIVKIPKVIPVPKFYPVKKPIPIGIPVPVPKIYKVPVIKPVPYKKYIPIGIPKKVPKFVPVPVKKIIKVPKPYYVPVKVPYVSVSYMKTPMAVDVPTMKKTPGFKGMPGNGKGMLGKLALGGGKAGLGKLALGGGKAGLGKLALGGAGLAGMGSSGFLPEDKAALGAMSGFGDMKNFGNVFGAEAGSPMHAASKAAESYVNIISSGANVFQSIDSETGAEMPFE